MMPWCAHSSAGAPTGELESKCLAFLAIEWHVRVIISSVERRNCEMYISINKCACAFQHEFLHTVWKVQSQFVLSVAVGRRGIFADPFSPALES